MERSMIRLNIVGLTASDLCEAASNALETSSEVYGLCQHHRTHSNMPHNITSVANVWYNGILVTCLTCAEKLACLTASRLLLLLAQLSTIDLSV